MECSHPRVTVDDILNERQVEALQLEALNGGPVADPKAVGLCKNHWVFRLILKSPFKYTDNVDGVKKVGTQPETPRLLRVTPLVYVPPLLTYLDNKEMHKPTGLSRADYREFDLP